jgi:predicted GH43/DUF377 family glycosyl hydrolase
MKRQFLFFCFLASIYADVEPDIPNPPPPKVDQFSLNTLADFEAIGNKIVKKTQMLWFHNYPDSYNPSLIKIEQGFLMTFRFHPDFYNQPWLSDIVIVRLDENLDPISEPQVLSTRQRGSRTPSQSEDARLFSYRGRIFLIFNDTIDELWFSSACRRDMFIAELFDENGEFRLSNPLKLRYENEYNYRICQKNWIPFEWDKTLLLTYTLSPHAVLYPNLKNGDCYHCHESGAKIEWEFGELRGGTPPLLVDGEYLAFFHSARPLATLASYGGFLWHYFAGAYTFSAEPPFELRKISPIPLIADGFYTQSNQPKRVIFPGGFTISGDTIYLAYGKDDCEIWIATIDKKELLNFLEPVKQLTVP